MLFFGCAILRKENKRSNTHTHTHTKKKEFDGMANIAPSYMHLCYIIWIGLGVAGYTVGRFLFCCVSGNVTQKIKELKEMEDFKNVLLFWLKCCVSFFFAKQSLKTFDCNNVFVSFLFSFLFFCSCVHSKVAL